MTTSPDGSWPYMREHPDKLVLDTVPGHAPSPLPPVRIFLGTEEGQYRAERVFVWSVLQVRDPSRVYEIHLMKNVAGFDRRGWRTGFTCYRFAIPDFAGRSGKAIYNDVDQIYLADPALLFDLPLDGHGYLAIDARDTSVMLIDCAKMLPWWNRAAASAHGAKGPLTKQPAEVPGLWGELDGHWNARDLEYAEGRTKCLHYTALHQQPWNPFPEAYSYHENPLAYIWHDLERGADEAGFEVFMKDRPSPLFAAVLGSNQPRPPAPAGPLLSPSAGILLQAVGAGTLLVTGMNGAQDAPLGAAALEPVRHDFARSGGNLPDGSFDAVAAAGIFERVPGADANWVLRELFAKASRALVLRITTTAEAGVGSEEWWRRRIGAIAAHHPGVSWQLDAVRTLTTGAVEVGAIQVRRVTPPAQPLIWALTGENPAADRQVLRIGAALGGRLEEKRLAFGPLAALRGLVSRASTGGLDPAGSDPLSPPWPDVLIASGKHAAPVARWVRARSGGRTRLVQLGRPGGPFSLFDLIVATPDDRLPIRDNVLQVAAQLAEPASRPAAAKGTGHPVTALLLSNALGPYRLDEARARELGRAAAAEAARHGGSLTIAADPGFAAKLLAAVREAAGPAEVPERAEDPRPAAIATADRFILTAGDADMLAEASLTGRPIALFGLPRWYDEAPVVKPLVGGVLRLLGGDTYRGTPLQQHIPGRFMDWLTTRGLAFRPRDLEALQRSLEARGLLVRLGGEGPVAAPRPLNDLQRVVTRVRGLLSEATQAG
ncbi:MAG: ELM1/GtrOC1 family putative glycosyltransferase [Geminicoccaceae bacterium]